MAQRDDRRDAVAGPSPLRKIVLLVALKVAVLAVVVLFVVQSV